MGPAEEIKRLHQAEQDEGLTDLWLVCFTGREEKRYWWDKIWLTNRDFRHCYAMQYQAFTQRWVLIDWRAAGCDIGIFEHYEMEYVFNQLARMDGTAVMYKRPALAEKDVHYRFPFLYCVQAVMQVVNLPTKWTFTPKQLYNRLINDGGEELLNYRSASDGRITEHTETNEAAEGNRTTAACHQQADA
jgi:hypothetical protein